MAESTFKLTFLGDTSRAEAALRRLENRAAGFGGTMRRIGEAAGGFLVSGGIEGGVRMAADAFMDATKAGSDYNEVLSKSNTIFGEQAKVIEDWAGTASSKFGQSKTQALDAAGAFGNMFIQLGIGRQEAVKMSKQMVELASDFASFHNADITQVLEAQQAAFRGEYDSVQRFVPTITAAAVQQKALEMGLAKTTKELTMQDKALATQALLMEGAGDATGDFARTQDGAANKTREMNAKLADMQTQIGVKLLPVQLAFINFMVDVGIPALGMFANVLAEHVFPALEKVAGMLAAAWDYATKFINAVKDIPGMGTVGSAASSIGLPGAIGKGLLSSMPGGQLFQLANIANAFGTKRASGGPVEAGQMYWVGEKGPEPFIPTVDGWILPNDLMGNNTLANKMGYADQYVDVTGVDDRRPAHTSVVYKAALAEMGPMHRMPDWWFPNREGRPNPDDALGYPYWINGGDGYTEPWLPEEWDPSRPNRGAQQPIVINVAGFVHGSSAELMQAVRQALTDLDVRGMGVR